MVGILVAERSAVKNRLRREFAGRRWCCSREARSESKLMVVFVCVAFRLVLGWRVRFVGESLNAAQLIEYWWVKVYL